MKKIVQSNTFQLITLLLLGGIIKLIYIGEMGIGGDESFSVYASQLKPSQIFDWLSTGDNPPLWEIILHYWTKLFGISEVAIRFPSYIFNILTIIPIYIIGEKYVKKYVGLFASLLFIFSSFSLFFAHEARVYSLVGLLSIASVLFFLKSINSEKSNKSLIYLTLINGLLLYSHYLTYWIILIQIIIFLSHKSVRQKLKWAYIIHLFSLFILFLPLAPVIFNRFMNSGVNGTWITPVSGINDFYNMLWKFSNQPVVTVIFITILFASIIKIVLSKSKPINKNVKFINLLIWIPLTVSFALSFKVGFFLDRYFYFLSPLFYLSVTSSLFFLFSKSNKISLISGSVITILMLLTFSISTQDRKVSGYHKNTKSIVDEIKKYNNRQNTIIALCPSFYDKEIMYYLDKNTFKTYQEEYNKVPTFKKPLNQKHIYPINHFNELSIPEGTTQVIFVNNSGEFHAPNNGVKENLEKIFRWEKTYLVDNTEFNVYNQKR